MPRLPPRRARPCRLSLERCACPPAVECRAPNGRLDLLIVEILESIAIADDSEIARIEAMELLLGVKEEEPSAERAFDGLDRQL